VIAPAAKPKPAGLRLTPLGGLIAGAYVGAMVPAMIIGMMIGAEQSDGAFGQLAIPLGVVSGPLILFAEFADLFDGRPLFALRILPWAVPAAVLGGWLGRRWAQAAGRAAAGAAAGR
jgi:hypothetical protein